MIGRTRKNKAEREGVRSSRVKAQQPIASLSQHLAAGWPAHPSDLPGEENSTPHHDPSLKKGVLGPLLLPFPIPAPPTHSPPHLRQLRPRPSFRLQGHCPTVKWLPALAGSQPPGGCWMLPDSGVAPDRRPDQGDVSPGQRCGGVGRASPCLIVSMASASRAAGRPNSTSACCRPGSWALQPVRVGRCRPLLALRLAPRS